MNYIASRALGVCFGSVAIVLFAAACAGGIGTPAGSGFPITAEPKNAMGPSHLSPKLYIANSAGGVFVYSTESNPTLLQTITNGVPKPGGIWVDKNGVLYAVNVPGNSDQTSLTEYKPGASVPFRTITDGVIDCTYVAVDKVGNVYVSCINPSNQSLSLEIYPKGKLSPARILTVPQPPHTDVRITGLAFDSSGALLVGESLYLQPGVVYRLAPSSQTFTNLNLQNAPGGVIAVDKAGNLYTGTGSSVGNQTIAVYPPNATSPSREIQVQNIFAALAVRPGGELYVETISNGPPEISVYASGSNSPKQTFDVAAGGVGLAVSR